MASNPGKIEETRLTALEEQVAHQAVTIEELSSSIALQWEQMDQMKLKLDALTRRFLDLEEATGPSPEITKPPHY